MVAVVVWSLSRVQLLGPHGLYSLPGSSVHGIHQARILEWARVLAISFSRESSRLGDQTQVSCIAGRFFAHWAIKYLGLKKKKKLEDQRITFSRDFFTRIQNSLHKLLPMNFLITCSDIWSWWKHREESLDRMTLTHSTFLGLYLYCVNYPTAIVLASDLFPIWW